MNFEHLLNIIIKNKPNLRDRKKTFIFIKYHYELLLLKKKKLKLGAISFEITQYMVFEIPLTEEIEIRYIRQDNTEQDELKLENQINALK